MVVNDGKAVHIAHVCLQWLFTSTISQSWIFLGFSLIQLQSLFLSIIFLVNSILNKNVGIKPNLSVQIVFVNVPGNTVDDDNDTVNWEVGYEDGNDDYKEAEQLLHVCLQKLFTVPILQYWSMLTCLFIHEHVLFFFFPPSEENLDVVFPSSSLHSMLWEGNEVGTGDINVGLCEACKLGFWLVSTVGTIVLSIVGIIDGFEVGIDEYLYEGCDEGISLGLDVNWKEGSIVGSDEELYVGCMDGNNVKDSSFWSVDTDVGKTVQSLHVCLQWYFTFVILQILSLILFLLNHLQFLALFENFNFGMLLDLSLHSEFELCDGLVDGMYEDNSVGSSEGYNVGTIDGCEVGINEWLSLGTDDRISVSNIVGSKLEVEVGCKEGSIVGSDEEICDGLVDGKYEDSSVGFIEEYNVRTTDGCEVGNGEGLTVGCSNGKPVHISHVCLQWLFNSSNLQSLFFFFSSFTQLQSLFLINFSFFPLLYLNKKVGIKPDLSAQIGSANVDGNIVDDDGNNEESTDGCEDGSNDSNEAVQLLHVCLQKLFTDWISQNSFMSTCFFIHEHDLFIFFSPSKENIDVFPSSSLHSMFGEGKDVETEGIKCCEVGIDE